MRPINRFTRFSLVPHGIALAFGAVAQAHALGTSTAEERAKIKADLVGHSAVQPWSAGEFFPAVIAREEHYGAVMSRDERAIFRMTGQREPLFTSWVLTIGAYERAYASYDDAHAVACWACQGGRIIPERYAELIAAA